MPKIKVKNIPTNILDRICSNEDSFCEKCPLNINETCTRIRLDEFENEVVELSEQDFPTNREWMESLSNFELATLMTSGYTVKDGKLKGLNATTNLMTDINEVTEWLSQPCVYLMEEK